MPASSINRLVRANKNTRLDPRLQNETPPPHSTSTPQGVEWGGGRGPFIKDEMQRIHLQGRLGQTPKMNNVYKAGNEHAHKILLIATMQVCSRTCTRCPRTWTHRMQLSRVIIAPACFCLQHDCISKSAVESKKQGWIITTKGGACKYQHECAL